MQFWIREEITRGDDRPYLSRLIVFRCRWFGIYLHHFRSSDDPCMHDHPWPFISVILWGGYWETTWSDEPIGRGSLKTVCKWHPPGSVLFRSSLFTHKIIINPRRPAVSLVITGPRRRRWGFWTRRGWVPWQMYRSSEHCV